VTSDYKPTGVSHSLVSQNKRLLNARIRVEQMKVAEASALLEIKRLESLPEFQGIEDRNYVTLTLGNRPLTSQRTIDEAKRRVRAHKKELREISK